MPEATPASTLGGVERARPFGHLAAEQTASSLLDACDHLAMQIVAQVRAHLGPYVRGVIQRSPTRFVFMSSTKRSSNSSHRLRIRTEFRQTTLSPGLYSGNVASRDRLARPQVREDQTEAGGSP